jgi:hypothetical protein
MPLTYKTDGWYWGSQGPFSSKDKALAVARVAHATGFKEAQMTYTIQDFVLCMLHSQTNAHILHLQSRSYAEHKALQKYYESIDGILDDFVEAYQGKHGIIENYPATYEAPTKPLEYMVSLLDYLTQARPSLPQDSELLNILDEMAQLLDSTIYKLRFLG